MGFFVVAGVVLAICLTCPVLGGPVSVPSIFSENMVLQRDVPIPVWGWADDGEEITVTCGNQKAQTVAKDGAWRVTLPPLQAGGPYTLAIFSKDVNKTLMFTQVMVGEVWLVCGQSNALMSVEDSDGAQQAAAERVNYPNIRIASMGRRDPHLVTTPQTETLGFWGPVKWENSIYTVPRNNRTDIPGCTSAVSYYFARELYQYLGGKMPVGMVEVTAIMPVESWIDDETIANTPALLPLRGKGYPNATSRCFNANIAPLAPFPVRGVIYYQGEMNAGRGLEYRASLPALIASWRKTWQNPDLPFLIVQLPGFIKPLGPGDKRLDMDAATLAQFQKESSDHGYCGVREAQLLTWEKTPHTGMAITIDLGDPYDIHPKRKLPVAQRLFLQARQLVYGEKDLVASGPVPEKIDVQGDRFVIHFKYTGGGLVAKGGELQGFEISTDGKTFLPAQARIDGNTVILTHPDVPAPKAMRYAWAGYPLCSLYNVEGLPATPFRYPID